MQIEILLATYNGEAFLQQQLSSIAAQSHDDWVLTVSDDGSTDRTMELILGFRELYENRVRIFTNQTKLGPAKNFMSLLGNSEAELVAFCDQDDVWLPHKLTTLKDLYDQIECDETGVMHPVVLCSDAKVVDSRLRETAPSLFEALKVVDPNCETFEYLKLRNCFTGCTMLLNRRAADLAVAEANRMWVEKRINVTMHDHWIGLVVAKHAGQIIRCYKSLILYRQHGNNAVGVQSSQLNIKNLSKKIKNIVHKFFVARFLDSKTTFINYILKYLTIWIKQR